MAASASPARMPSRSVAFSTSSTGKIPAKTPEPIITGTKRDPSSLVQEATSSGARVTMPWSFSVRITSSPAMTPYAPSNLPPEGWESRWLPITTAAALASLPGRRAKIFPIASQRTARAASRAHRTNWSRPSRSAAVSVMRRTPPLGVAPMRARSISDFHRRSASILILISQTGAYRPVAGCDKRASCAPGGAIGMPVAVRDIVRNPVKEKLARGEVVSSMTARLVSSIEIVRIAKSAGFDSLYIDLEHSSFSMETTSQICVMALEAGIPAFVRVPANTPEYISRVLDGGALGVIAPGVRSAGEARAVVAAAKYPPLGERGLSAGLPQLQFRAFPATETLPALNDATLVSVQFESKAALEAMDEIVAVDGVDLVLIGTNDLMVDLGIPGQYDHPKVRDAYERTIAACSKRGKHVGVGGLGSRPDLMAQYVKMGARYVSTGTDLAFLMAACTQRAKQVRDLQL